MRGKKETEYYYLEYGDIIEEGDQVDMSNDGWRDRPKWALAKNVGMLAVDPAYPAHRIYRRKLETVCEEKVQKEGDVTLEVHFDPDPPIFKLDLCEECSKKIKDQICGKAQTEEDGK